MRFCLADVFLLALLGSTGEQNDKRAAIPAEVNAVAGGQIKSCIRENAVANGFDVG